MRAVYDVSRLARPCGLAEGSKGSAYLRPVEAGADSDTEGRIGKSNFSGSTRSCATDSNRMARIPTVCAAFTFTSLSWMNDVS